MSWEYKFDAKGDYQLLQHKQKYNWFMKKWRSVLHKIGFHPSSMVFSPAFADSDVIFLKCDFCGRDSIKY